MLPIIILDFKVNLKAVPYSRIIWYKIEISGVNLWPANQTLVAQYWAADHSLSSTDVYYTLHTLKLLKWLVSWIVLNWCIFYFMHVYCSVVLCCQI